MSQLTTAHGFWFRRNDPTPARERMNKAVAALTRARCLQILVDYGFGGLLAGLSLATVAVPVARLQPSHYPPWQIAGAVILVALTVALLVGWRRRPESLDVAIHADLALKLKQRFSTAWEFMTVHGDSTLAERLAVQAVNAGLPAFPGMVFPLRVNRCGQLAPLAATALLLVSVIDLDRTQAPVPRALDEQVVSEGRRLGAFGRAMQERAARDRLPRSARQATQIERLGARMESGALSRSQALGELRRMGESLDRERQQAGAEASQAGGHRVHAQSAEDSRNASLPNPQAMLDRLRRGALASADRRVLHRYLDDLTRSGTLHQELQNALERHRAGADDALKVILENLARIDRARKEDKELGAAQEQVRLARENLDASRAGARPASGPGMEIYWGDDEDENPGDEGGANTGAHGSRGSQAAQAASHSGSQGNSGVATNRVHSPLRPDPGQSGPVLKPQGQAREGEVFVTQAPVLPKLGRPSVENVEMASEFVPQVEAVLSKEQYPAHYKEFVRRYFLNLSQGERAARERPPGAREAP